MSDTAVTDQPADIPATTETLSADFVSFPEKDFAVMCDLRVRVTDALARFNAAHEEAKSKKKAYDAAREMFEREFDRLVAKTRGEDLPLFNQTDQNEKAIKDSNARQLEHRLREVGKIEIDALVIAGWSDQQVIETEAWLDALEETEPGEELPPTPAWVLDPTVEPDKPADDEATNSSVAAEA